MPIDINVIWNIYKTTLEYQAAMKRFEYDSLSDLVLRYNPTYSQYVKSDVLEDMAESIYCYGFSEHEPTQDETQTVSRIKFAIPVAFAPDVNLSLGRFCEKNQ